MQKWIFILACSILLCGNTTIAQESAYEYYSSYMPIHEFDEEVWKEAKGDLNYDPIQKKKEEEDNNNNTNTSNNNNNSGSNNNNTSWISIGGDGVGSYLFKLILLILGVGLISLIVYRLIGGSFQYTPKSKASSNSGSVDIAQVEQNLHKSDMEILIDKALAEKNYMLAVRLHYLWAIKELNQQRLIKWKRDKTNRDYIRELGSSDLKKPFRKATRIFERVWYGSQNTLAQEEYHPIEQELKRFIQQVKSRRG